MIKVSFITNDQQVCIDIKKPPGNVRREIMGFGLVSSNSSPILFLPSTDRMRGGVIYCPFVHTKDLWVHMCHCSMFKLHKSEWGISLINSIISRLQLQMVENEWPIIPKSLKKYGFQHFLYPWLFISGFRISNLATRLCWIKKGLLCRVNLEWEDLLFWKLSSVYMASGCC